VGEYGEGQVIPDSIYSLLSCNMLIILVLFLVVRPLHERYMIRKIRMDILKSVSAVLENFHADLGRKLSDDFESFRVDIRKEVAIGKIADSEFDLE